MNSADLYYFENSGVVLLSGGTKTDACVNDNVDTHRCSVIKFYQQLQTDSGSCYPLL